MTKTEGLRRHLRTVVGAVIVIALAGAAGFGIGAGQEPQADPSDRIMIPLGEDAAAIMAAHGAGTTYVLASGVHRGQTLTPEDGDRITGEPGAVLNGAEVLAKTDFELRDGVWVMTGRTEEEFFAGVTDAGFERDAAIHDLWADSLRMQHVPAREDVDEPGSGSSTTTPTRSCWRRRPSSSVPWSCPTPGTRSSPMPATSRSATSP